jgi:hypothetical protein
MNQFATGFVDIICVCRNTDPSAERIDMFKEVRKENIMETNKDQNLSSGGQTPQVSPGTYSPVTVQNYDSLGALFLGIFALIMLVGWMRAEERSQQLR